MSDQHEKGVIRAMPSGGRKTVVITGASGLVATELIHVLLARGDCDVIAVSGKVETLSGRYADDSGVHCVELQCLGAAMGDAPVEALVHCAFARSSKGVDVASSLSYLKDLIGIVRDRNLSRFVNVSSQSVYGQCNPPLWTEQMPAAPDYPYAFGKFASEMMVAAAFGESEIERTSIRLSSVYENARFLNVFARNAINGDPIVVQGGGQRLSFIDVRDAASGLAAAATTRINVPVEPVYNLGIGKRRTIFEMAGDVAGSAKELYGLEPKIEIVDSDAIIDVGMDNSLFCQTFDWQPEYDYADMAASLLKQNSKGNSLVVQGDAQNEEVRL